MKTPLITAFALALGLVGCATNKPMTYLVLSPVYGVVYPASGPAIAVGQVIMPPVIDRSFLTTGNSETTLVVSYNAQWAAPLGGMAQTILARDLAARLPGHNVLMPGDSAASKALRVEVNVINFLPYPGHVILEADWSITNAAAKMSAQTSRAKIIVPSIMAPAGQAQAMSEALGVLADQIAARIAS